MAILRPVGTGMFIGGVAALVIGVGYAWLAAVFVVAGLALMLRADELDNRRRRTLGPAFEFKGKR